MTELRFHTKCFLAALAWALFAALAYSGEDPNKRDLEVSRQHHEALKEKDRDIAALKAEAAKWRAAAEQCRESTQVKKAPAMAASGAGKGGLDR